MRIKICGVTRPEDAALAVALGADAVGVVFVPESRRFVRDPVLFKEIRASLQPLTTPVGLFFNPSCADVEGVLEAVPDITLQFQGDESPAFCTSFGRPYIKGVRMAPDPVPADLVRRHEDTASAFLFDAYKKGVAGGTGETFGWDRVSAVRRDSRRPWMLAGGLSSGNVADAVQYAPWGLDLASGVEKEPGIKDADKMHRFFAAVAALEVPGQQF